MRYEGTCEHCGRDIGSGHDKSCPYGRCPCGFCLKPDGTCPFCDTGGPQ